jgi:RimJ/RimL family protein N-acetyltransferase
MLKGRRVVLRPIEPEHLAVYVRWFTDVEVLEYLGHFRPMNQAQEQAWYERQNQDPDSINFAVELDGRHIGGTGLHLHDHKNQSAEVGLFIGEKDLWNQGLGQDILATIVDYGFANLNLHRIYLRVFAENARAIHAYEKVGFVHEGRFREAEWRHGRWHDTVFMSILSQEWKARL